MEKCDGVDCYPVCNYCKSYDFNPGPDGEYLNNGFCRLFEMKKEPSDSCEDFKCFNIKPKV